MENTTFSGASLEEALSGDLLERPEVMLIGMVKQSQTPGYISFTGGTCEQWIDVPTEVIERAEQLGRRLCKDHSHPIMRLTFKESQDPYARILASLLSQQSSAPSSGTPSMPPGAPSQGMPMGNRMATGPGGPPATPGMSQMAAGRLGGVGGLGGLGGGLGAWGCWDSTCTECILWEYVCNGSACWWYCRNWIERPCERCIWPW